VDVTGITRKRNGLSHSGHDDRPIQEKHDIANFGNNCTTPGKLDTEN